MSFPKRFNCFKLAKTNGDQQSNNETSCICNLCYRTHWDIEKQNGRKCICTSGFICSDCLNPTKNPDVVNYQDVVNKCPLCSRYWGAEKENETSNIQNPYHPNNDLGSNNTINVQVSLVEVHVYSNQNFDQISSPFPFRIRRNNSVGPEIDLELNHSIYYFRPRDRIEHLFNRKISDKTRSIINACLFIIYGICISYILGLLFTLYLTSGNSQNIFTWIGIFGCLFFGVLCLGCSNIISQCICRTCWMTRMDSWFLKTYDDGD